MAQQESGWPLGLEPVNMRIGLMRNREFSGSISFNTLLTSSANSSADSSSDLDTESTGSFFHDKSITLGSLIGVSSILELSARSIRGRKREEALTGKKSYKSKIWFFSLCSKTDVDTESVINPPSLGHFLEVERKAASDYMINQNSSILEPYEFPEAHLVSESNSLFVDGRVAPPVQSSPNFGGSDNGTEYDGPILFSCICGQLTD